MINRIFQSVESAFFDVFDGATIMIGGFGGAGTPHNLVMGLIKSKVKNLTLICNGFNNIIVMTDWRRISKVIMSFPTTTRSGGKANPLLEGIESGGIDVEIVPQGVLAERIRCGGAGIPAFFTFTGADTLLSESKETRNYHGKESVLETALTADFALVQAWKSDRMGNLIYRKTARNFNPIMATAAKVVIAEVSELVTIGDMDGDEIHTPGIFVNRVVKIQPKSTEVHQVKS